MQQQQEQVVVNHTSCDELKNRATRLSRHPNPSLFAAGMLAATTHNNVVDKETLCMFNPTSQTCQRPFAGAGLNQVRDVRGFTVQRQVDTTRSYEMAVQRNAERERLKANAKCQRLATQTV